VIQVTANSWVLNYDELAKRPLLPFLSGVRLHNILQIKEEPMLNLGAKAPQPREMILDDIFLLRLKLLLHMTKDYLEGRDFSDLRRQIVVDNARHIQIESIELGHLDKAGMTDLNEPSSIFIDHCLYRCANDLAVLMELMAKGAPFDHQRHKTVQERFEAIRHIQKTAHFAELFPGFVN